MGIFGYWLLRGLRGEADLLPDGRIDEDEVFRYLPKSAKARPCAPAGLTLRQFQFKDIPQSIAERKGFHDSIGLITAAFYGEYGRAIGVGEGPEEPRHLQTVNFRPDRLLGGVQIRYVYARELEKLQD